MNHNIKTSYIIFLLLLGRSCNECRCEDVLQSAVKLDSNTIIPTCQLGFLNYSGVKNITAFP